MVQGLDIPPTKNQSYGWAKNPCGLSPVVCTSIWIGPMMDHINLASVHVVCIITRVRTDMGHLSHICIYIYFLEDMDYLYIYIYLE